jgi:hypothetical protein
MLRTLGAIVAAMCVAACGSERPDCAPCREGVSIADIEFSAAPAPNMRLEVCVEGGSCYRLRTGAPDLSLRSYPCSSSLPSPVDSLSQECWAGSNDGAWHVAIALPEDIDGKTVKAHSLSRRSPFEAEADGEVEATADGQCSCPPDTIAAIHAD